jgi:hypothetical protein
MFLYAELSTAESAGIFCYATIDVVRSTALSPALPSTAESTGIFCYATIDVVRSTAPSPALPSTAERAAPSIAKQQCSYNRVCKFC